MRVRTVIAAVAAAGTAIAAVAAVTAGTFAHADERIVGGQQANQAYSFMVSLQDQAGNHFCGAALIKPDAAVTAAHCVDGQNAQDLRVRVGSTNRTKSGSTAAVTEATIHPDYDPQQTGFNDIAVIRLDRPLSHGTVETAVNTPPDGTKIRLLGWGQTCPTRGCQQELPVKLQQLEARVLFDGRCDGSFDGPKELCVNSGSPGRGACFGDSGGPAVISGNNRFTLVGVTSRSSADFPECGRTNAIYSDVAKQKAFLRDALS